MPIIHFTPLTPEERKEEELRAAEKQKCEKELELLRSRHRNHGEELKRLEARAQSLRKKLKRLEERGWCVRMKRDFFDYIHPDIREELEASLPPCDY